MHIHPFSTVALTSTIRLFIRLIFFLLLLYFFFCCHRLFFVRSCFFFVSVLNGANATLLPHLLGTFDIVAVARIFQTLSLILYKFSPVYIAQCSYCGKNSIRFLSLLQIFFTHFVSFFFFWYFYYGFFCRFLLLPLLLSWV